MQRSRSLPCTLVMGLALVWQSTVPIVKPEQHPATADEGKSTKHKTELSDQKAGHKYSNI